MKKFLALTSVFVVMIGVLFSSCTNEKETPQSESNELINYGMEFASIHNDCLAYIYQGLNSAKTRGSVATDMEEMVLSLANMYISKHSSTRTTSEPLTQNMFSATIEDIQKKLSPKEKEYIEPILSNQTIDFDNLIKEVALDLDLPEINRQAVICFITTYQASSQYWAEHVSEWKELISKPQTRVSFASVAFADAWWGYQGVMSSGLNPWVGGGAAAVGSACAFLH